ncbi:DUF3135 domain-containing protein [Marinobacter panjinensis]|uniref:DUF3135 domain-containing protein n=1 Tax=Marinobacter panjinensis TaxID=2576384 RepID=A0A4U6R6P2_9GAMM|nr:DUF3135 domain-containing protein [Marinobacter panjinensis]
MAFTSLGVASLISNYTPRFRPQKNLHAHLWSPSNKSVPVFPAAIEDCIRRSSECNQRRLRGLQFVIDARRRTAGSPMKALLDIQAMMYDSLLGLQQALLVQQRPCAPTTPTSARVLRFRSHRSSVD